MDTLSVTVSVIGVIALVSDVSKALSEMCNMDKTFIREVTHHVRHGCLYSLPMQALDIEKQRSTTSRCLQSFMYSITNKSDLGDRTSNGSHGLETLNCLFPYCKASFKDDEALSLHVGSHLDVLPSATDGSFELITDELSSLQKATEAIGEIMRRYENIECSEGESIKRPSRRLYSALEMLRELAERQGTSSGYTPQGRGIEEGTPVDKWRPLSYASLQSFQRGLIKTTERARLKIDGSMRCDLEWYKLEKYAHSPSNTHGFGGGARSVDDHTSLYRYCQRSYGQELGVLDLSCLILGKIVCPPLQLDPSSSLDQSIQHLFPSIYQLVTTLSRHHAVALSMSLVSTSLTVLALFLPFSHIDEKCRSPVLVCCWMALVASGPFWTYLGGSAASFFLVFMPYAMSVGISIGLLWYWFAMERDHQMGMK